MAWRLWIIRSTGRSKYRFVLVTDVPLTPNPNLAVTKVPDATPGIIAKYALSDEQAVLARVRYNRLIDIFLGITCYSLQNHLVALFEFEQHDDDIRVASEKHYRLVPPDAVTEEDLARYRRRLSDRT